MKRNELIKALRRLKVETGSLACMGCGHEHGCSVHGCAIINEAIAQLQLQKETTEFKVSRIKKCPRCGCGSDEDIVHLQMYFYPKDGFRRYGVLCENCGAEVSNLKTADEAIEAWNRRVTDDEV